ncbi:hypothetical protein SLA2020_006140 [Shorea laevis]
MEEYTQLLNLMTQKKEEDRKLELRLGPPGEVELLGCKNGAKRAFQHTVEAKNGENPSSTTSGRDTQKDKQHFNPLILKQFSSMAEESSQHTDKKANTSNERSMACPPVVGWPPIRSSRRNLTGSSLSKLASESPKEESVRKLEKNQFVKINMEGIPIGRKVNLKAYNSYEELSIAIDRLFSGLLAVQRNSSSTQNGSKIEESSKTSEESLAGSEEYTLVYEDEEGDRILVGDVPWEMFVSSATRLLVLKSSELS